MTPHKYFRFAIAEAILVRAQVTIAAGKAYANRSISVVASDGGAVDLPDGHTGTPPTDDIGELQGTINCDANGTCVGEVASASAPARMGKYLKRWNWEFDGMTIETTQQRIYVVYSDQQEAPMEVPWALVLELALSFDYNETANLQDLLAGIRTTLHYSSWTNSSIPFVFLRSTSTVLRYRGTPLRSNTITSLPSRVEQQFQLKDLLVSFDAVESFNSWSLDCRDFSNLATIMARSLGVTGIYPRNYRSGVMGTDPVILNEVFFAQRLTTNDTARVAFHQAVFHGRFDDLMRPIVP